MKHQAAYTLLWLAGNEPTQKDVQAFMTKSGVSIDKEALAAFFKALDGKTVTGACTAGAKKLVAMPSGGARAAPAGGAAGAGAAAAAPVEEKKEEEAEQVDMGNLFGDDEEDY